MFKKVLVANRGEIATRIIRACNELGIVAVAIYSEADTTSLHVKKADEAYLIGPGPVEGYLNVHRIVDLALKIGVDAIHPGYGFLAENPKFPELCEKNKITFIGPSSKAMREMGNKIEARKIMKKAGVPVIPGSDGEVDVDEALRLAKDIGYPVMLKASSGGGGRGLRRARNAKELKKSFDSASSEAKLSFGDPSLFIEKYIEASHHIEFQILADNYGHIIHLGERDCSIQRRHQKLIEIAPSLILDQEERDIIGAIAVKGAKAAGYTNAGTIEFLVDRDKNFYFMEMNTRIQVEHTVTEEITGIDLVKKQIEIASGKRLDIAQDDVFIRGYAIECRINAEDPKKDFVPNTGRVTAYYSPGGIGVRIDGAIYKDYVIPSFYDSMVIKLIVKGLSWEEALSRLDRALREFVIRGVKTTIPYLHKITHDKDFRKGTFDTTFIEKKPYLLEYEDVKDPRDLVAAISSALAAHYGF
ncbi:MAG: acetyl-CoA carboxylase biotin carboxylase subunit [Thermodesulfobacteriota bacterium]